MPGHGANPLSHVLDSHELELPWFNPPTFELKIHLPSILGIQITRFMVMELLAAILVIAVMIPVVRHICRHHVSRGGFINMSRRCCCSSATRSRGRRSAVTGPTGSCPTSGRSSSSCSSTTCWA